MRERMTGEGIGVAYEASLTGEALAYFSQAMRRTAFILLKRIAGRWSDARLSV
jgi:hypothetical protein